MQAKTRNKPRVEGVLETAVYVEDMVRARAFYESVLGFEVMFRDERLCAYAAGPSVFLLFKRGASDQNTQMKIGNIPGHDGQGRLHMAFAIKADALAAWHETFAEHGVPIEGRVEWPKGGISIYFRDPDGNLLEFATPGLWQNY